MIIFAFIQSSVWIFVYLIRELLVSLSSLCSSSSSRLPMALSTQRTSAFLSSADQSAPRQWNHDVFLSFRGVDTRNSFVSHLYHELQHMGIKTFKDDPKLERGTTISSELFNAIQESRLAIVVLSQNYASSSWCLEELTKILQCMKSKGTVLPVFYNVDPSDVRKQSGSFAGAFVEHEKRFREDIEKVMRWRDALTEVANLSGLDSKNECERKLIEKIVEWVWSKVHRTYKLLDSTELVGIKFTPEQIDLLLAPSDDVRFIGIWGMGGIGKTSIAKQVYESISIHFEVSCFLANVREVSERGHLVDLQRQLLFPILKEQIIRVWDEQWGTYFIKNCLCNKKVLLILDDVNESSQLEKLVGEKDWFGKGSRIIITTRDERLLVKHDMQISYKVEGLGDDEALELFSRNAFKKIEPEEGFQELSKCFVNYARGLPLALKILGCSMYKRDRDEWKSELDKLRKIPESTIFDLLKLSYDGLDEMNKNIFLDIAFFYKGKGKEEVIEILDSYGVCGRIGINALIHKSLLTIARNNIVEMHDLIQEMALEIVRRENPEEPGERSRLCHHNDISHVFLNNTATNKIQGIALRMAELEEVGWNCEAFSKMLYLKFLEFDNVIISSNPTFLPNSLRIMKWNWYPSKIFPSDFQPIFLVRVEMRHNKLVRLWDGRKDLPNLKYMDLGYSKNLATTPNFTRIPKLEELCLEGCEKLVEIHPSIADLKWLKRLDFGGCSKVKKIPEFSGEMKNLLMLNLGGTSIENLPSSVGCLVGLSTLHLSNCKNLLGLPSAICNLKSLEWLLAEGCSNLEELPENLGDMECLEWLSLDGTAIRQLPRSIVRLKNLEILSRCGSEAYKSRFWWGLPCLSQRKDFVMGSLHGLCSLTALCLSDCGLCEGDLLGDIGCLSSLQELDLSGNNFVTLPVSFRYLSKLKSFDLARCQRLQQFPHLTSNYLVSIDIDDCTSLIMFPSPPTWNGNIRNYGVKLSCVNCFGLVENEGGCDSLILGVLWRFLQVQVGQLNIVTPGRRIPEWFKNQSVGDSLIVELPLDSCSTWMGFALCAVFEEDHPNPAHDLSKFDYFTVDCWSGKKQLANVSLKIGHVVSDHLCVFYVSSEDWKRQCSQMKILFQTYYKSHTWPSDRRNCSSIKKCGLRLVHEQDVEQLNQIMMMNQAINISITDSLRNSADASASGSSQQKSLCCKKSYALAKGFLTKLVKIFSLLLTTAVFMKSFNNGDKWGCLGLLIWRVTTLMSYLGLVPSYFSLLLKSLIKSVILKRGAKFLLTLLKTPPPQVTVHKYLKGQ
ncbi:PREDICTED: TMV resistance N [Prunus dulcis]|uniref:ADP-ribosyl cyclase/cyclic ADP-ribose hydrolase n=2 Tax=Prunus dulcis TaxID=3755 RepID=A0A5E4G188_PRUDU|nr:PREDICTED: TMV resistance N [Prunus dulcis]